MKMAPMDLQNKNNRLLDKSFTLRQDINGPQFEELEFLLCGQILKTAEVREKLSHAQIRGKRAHIPHF